jgi:anti-sigma-K factor RskA
MTAVADRDDDTALAGEYVLGLLTPAEARDFEARLGRDPDLRGAVIEYSEAFVTLTDRVAPVAAPAHVKAALDARLFPASARPRLSLGRLVLGAMTGAALAVLALVVALPFLSPPGAVPELRAEIAAEAQGIVVVASLDLDTGTLDVARTAGAPLPGRSLQLWLIPQGEAVPIPVAVIDAEASTQQVPPELAARFRDGTLAISDEPLGGSPTGTPTNVLGAGPVTLL